MTTRIHDFLGHKMLLIAYGNALTECKWLPDDADPILSSGSEEELSVINRAIIQITEFLEGKRTEFDIPLRLKGTDFRQKVWNGLRKIPYGQTITYKELAQRIGSPKGYRAVANACGANPCPILIPCHRVVASGGHLGGYSGGLDIKLALINTENQNTDNFVL